ncbi:tetratricopeptide repeat protein [Actinoplanes friuliensis]|uniref:Pentatricopeptide repeat-containing protein n=1 Tax=Actinoplanes friuliensis DSM 7358 TaxID=1246995 RepID=U5WCY4_9ACTN|nr:tetratricopeptide repeat protein [Actinoplanes friuliensis]AGZ45875.1 Pentatricopeptide repeat-containing protein [Actinoplanes friuliensis DSM 7358]
MDESRRSADRDLEQARAALERGEMHHAADHLAGAIAHAPTLPETHELLSRLAARADGGLELFPLEQHAFVGTVVARAHLLAAAGRPEDGLPLLVAASGHTPGVDWAGVPWVIDPGLGVRMEPGLLAQIVMQLCTAIGDPAPEAGRDALRPYLTLVRHAVEAHPEQAMLLGAGSALARRLGEATLAVDWAVRGARLRPSKLAEIWLGYAYRSAGRIPESLAALRRAVMYDPEDLSVYADIAGTLADHGRLDDALAWADRALAKDPEFDCAVHTAHRLRYRADGDLAHLVRLADFQRDHPDATHEHADLADCCADQPWLSRVPSAPAAATDPAREPFVAGRPSDEAVERLHRLAHPLWPHPPAAYDAALGLVLVEPEDLLALIARPPAAPDNEVGLALAAHDPALWARCSQVWACLGLLHHRTDEPWAESARRRLLVDLATQGTDQITEAALFALVTSAWIDPEARADVGTLVTRRLDDVATAGHPIAWSLAQLALATPGLDAEVRERAAAVVAAEEEYTVPLVPRQRRRGGRLRRWLSGRTTR